MHAILNSFFLVQFFYFFCVLHKINELTRKDTVFTFFFQNWDHDARIAIVVKTLSSNLQLHKASCWEERN